MVKEEKSGNVVEYDTGRGIIVRIAAAAPKASTPTARRDTRVQITAENGESVSLPLKDVRHLMQALEWVLKDERTK